MTPMSNANHETLRTILGARPGESTLDAGRRVAKEEGAIVERATDMVDQIEKQTAIAKAAILALRKDTPEEDRAIAIASLEATGNLPPGSFAAEKAQSEAERLRAERGFLAKAIAAAALKAGGYDGEAPLTGPHLVLLCRDMADQIVRQTAIAAAERALRKAKSGEAFMAATDALSKLGVEP